MGKYVTCLLSACLLSQPVHANENPAEPRGAHRFQEGLATVSVAGKWGFIDRTGSIVIPPQYDFLTGMFEGHALASLNGETFTIDRSGRIVDVDLKLFPHYSVGPLQEFNETDLDGNDRWGYRNAEGEVVTPPVYDMVDYRDGIHIIGMRDAGALYPHNFEGFVGDDGTVLVKPVMQWLGPFSEGLANVIQDYRHHFIDRQGRRAFAGDFTTALDFSEGLVAVNLAEPVVPDAINFIGAGEWTFIDKQGQQAIAATFKQAGSFHDGYAVVQTDGLRWGVIDKQGRYLVEPIYTQIEHLPGSGLFIVAVETNQYRLAFGLLDYKGQTVVEPRYSRIQAVGEGMAGVLEEGPGAKWGFVNNAGELVVEYRFDEVRAFSEGYANVRIGDQRGYIDKTGNYLWMPSR